MVVGCGVGRSGELPHASDNDRAKHLQRGGGEGSSVNMLLLIEFQEIENLRN